MMYAPNLSFPQSAVQRSVGNLTNYFPAVRFRTSRNDSSVKAEFKDQKCFKLTIKI